MTRIIPFAFSAFDFPIHFFFWNNRSSKHDNCTHTDIFVFFCIKLDVLHGVLSLHLLKFFDCGLFSIEWMNLYKLNLKKIIYFFSKNTYQLVTNSHTHIVVWQKKNSSAPSHSFSPVLRKFLSCLNWNFFLSEKSY